MGAQRDYCTKITSAGGNTSRRGNRAAHSGQACSIGHMKDLTARRDAHDEQPTCIVECRGGDQELTRDGIARDAGKPALQHLYAAAHDEFVPFVADVGRRKSKELNCRGFVAGCSMGSAGVGAGGAQESSRVVSRVVDGPGITKPDGLIFQDRLAGEDCSKANAAHTSRNSTASDANPSS